FVLLRAFAVALGLRLGGEPGQRDEQSVRGDTRGVAEPADRLRGELAVPAVERRLDSARVAHWSLDHLNEHRNILPLEPMDIASPAGITLETVRRGRRRVDGPLCMARRHSARVRPHAKCGRTTLTWYRVRAGSRRSRPGSASPRPAGR